MLLHRFEVEGLAHYSYAVGCPDAGVMAIVDPERNVDRYLEFADRHSMRIGHVLETHIHADYASGARELAHRCGIEPAVSGYDKGETYEIAFKHCDLADGDAIELGSVRITALFTPGHTPEHLSYLVHDRQASRDEPALLLSGDFLFVGSLGRPDLLGEEAKRGLAHALFRSVREKLAGLPDRLTVLPAHGAGSMCGSGMGGQASSTLGNERLANPYLDPGLTETQFVEKILGSVPPFPPYYRRMKTLNAKGPPLLGDRPGLEALVPETFQGRLDSGHVAVDVRDPSAFCGGHLPDSFWMGAGPLLAVWAAWLVPDETPLLLVSEDQGQAAYAGRTLARDGLDGVVGYLQGGLDAWRQEDRPVRRASTTTVDELHDRLGAAAPPTVLDVRTDREWDAGHIDGAIHVFGGELPGRLGELPSGPAPLAVVCGGGYRSLVAISVLERAGYEGLLNVTGGMGAWRAAHLPVACAASAVGLAGGTP